MIKNLEETLSQIRPHLKEYLVEKGIVFGNTHFQCPNFRVHKRNDKKEAANFWPDDNHFKCHMCTARGDIFDAAHYLEGRPVDGFEFVTDTVAYLAEKYGVNLDIIAPNSAEAYRRDIHKILERTAQILEEQNEATFGYLEERKWLEVKDVQFGYCDYDELIASLKSEGFAERLIRDSGLTNRGLFHNRLVFPLVNHYGKIVGFASRKMKDAEEGDKYLNHMTTEVYKKSSFIYNLMTARKYESIYVFEGYANVFTASANGLDNTVALCWNQMADNQFKLLEKCGIQEIILCLDSDNGGQTGLESILSSPISIQKTISVKIKDIPEFKDPDEYILNRGIDAFKSLPEYGVFDYRLKQLSEGKTDKKIVINLTAAEESKIEKEQKCKKIAEVLSVSVEAVVADVGEGVQDLTVVDSTLEREVLKFDEWAFSRTGTLLGLDMGFPILTHKLDGLQQGFYVLGADTNVGKTAFALCLARNLVLCNPEQVFVLMFSLDDPLVQIIPRLVSMRCGISINAIANPIWRIQKNETLNSGQVDAMLKERESAINELKMLSTGFMLKDGSSEPNMENLMNIEKAIKRYKVIADKRHLVVMIDSIYNINVPEETETRKKFMRISKTLKRWAGRYNASFLGICELRKKEYFGRKPHLEDIKEVIDLIYDSNVGMLLYNEMEHKPTTELKFWHSPANMEYPIVELMVKKNKTSAFKSSIFYKFYTDISRHQECTEEERKRYIGISYKEISRTAHAG